MTIESYSNAKFKYSEQQTDMPDKLITILIENRIMDKLRLSCS